MGHHRIIGYNPVRADVISGGMRMIFTRDEGSRESMPAVVEGHWTLQVYRSVVMHGIKSLSNLPVLTFSYDPTCA